MGEDLPWLVVFSLPPVPMSSKQQSSLCVTTLTEPPQLVQYTFQGLVTFLSLPEKAGKRPREELAGGRILATYKYKEDLVFT